MENPPERLINTTPIAKPSDNKTEMDESEYTLLLVFNLTRANPPIIETTSDTQIGLDFRKRPKAIPPNATWAMASPNKEYLFSTKNNPIREQLMEMAIPEIRARCKNSYCKKSII